MQIIRPNESESFWTRVNIDIFQVLPPEPLLSLEFVKWEKVGEKTKNWTKNWKMYIESFESKIILFYSRVFILYQ